MTKPAARPALRIKRVYESVEASDGFRILVDRLWPRGITKEHAAVQLWLKDIAPTAALRKWFGHDPARWEEFRTRYLAELRANDDAVAQVFDAAQHGPVTLMYAAHDERHNHAMVLLQYLSGR